MGDDPPMLYRTLEIIKMPWIAQKTTIEIHRYIIMMLYIHFSCAWQFCTNSLSGCRRVLFSEFRKNTSELLNEVFWQRFLKNNIFYCQIQELKRMPEYTYLFEIPSWLSWVFFLLFEYVNHRREIKFEEYD